MSRAREFADLAGSADAGGITGRNVLINGEFQVWQRGTSSSSNGYRTADRWRLNLSGASATASQGTFANGQTAVPGNPQFYMALDVTTGNDNCGWQYRIEDTQKFNSDVYTLSFWAKSATPRVMTVNSHTYDSSADVDDDNTVSPSTFTPTSSWQKFTFKITFSSMPNVGAFASGDYTHIGINQGSDTSTAAWKLDLALVQFEKGEQATPFEHRSFADELRRCQRYHQRFTGVSNGRVGFGTKTSATGARCVIPFNTAMRATPSHSITGTPRFETGAAAQNVSSINTSGANTLVGGFDVVTASGGAQNDPGVLDMGDGGYIFDAEL